MQIAIVHQHIAVTTPRSVVYLSEPSTRQPIAQDIHRYLLPELPRGIMKDCGDDFDGSRGVQGQESGRTKSTGPGLAGQTAVAADQIHKDYDTADGRRDGD